MSSQIHSPCLRNGSALAVLPSTRTLPLESCAWGSACGSSRLVALARLPDAITRGLGTCVFTPQLRSATRLSKSARLHHHERHIRHDHMVVKITCMAMKYLTMSDSPTPGWRMPKTKSETLSKEALVHLDESPPAQSQI